MTTRQNRHLIAEEGKFYYYHPSINSIYNIILFQLANLQIRHETARVVVCHTGYCIWTLYYLSGGFVWQYVWMYILHFHPQSHMQVKHFSH